MEFGLKVSEHAKQHGIIPSKSLGQNFIFDLSFCKKIIQHEQIEGSKILEIGPGVGGLTRAILMREPKHLLCIEKDMRCIGLLQDLKSSEDKLAIHLGDALKILQELQLSDALPTPQNSAQPQSYDAQRQLAEQIKQVDLIVSNLPYNVGTRILVELLENIVLGLIKPKSMTFMLQKEVADRILASPRSKAYGQLSVLIQAVCTPRKIFDVAPTVFCPPPKVMSSVLSFKPKDNCGAQLSFDVYNNMKQIVKHAFTYRRKILKTSLKNYLHLMENDMHAKRPEEIAVSDYIALATRAKDASQ